MPKYKKTKIINDSDFYSELIESRGRESIEQYESKRFDIDPNAKVKIIEHVWRRGDRYYKLAAEHYGDIGYWWLIALWNKKPTEADINFGDFIYIPTPLSDALKAAGE